VRSGALIRSDHHGRLTDEGRAAVRAIQAGMIIDLRTEAECRRDPSPFVDTPTYRHVPFEDPFDPTRPDGRLAEVYKGTLDRYRSFVGAAVVAVAEAPPGPVIVHCHAGKDRTGLLVALLLRGVGVTAEVVAEEYARSHAPLRPRYDPKLATITDPEEYDRMADRMSARAETMLAALAHLDQHYDGFGPYLTGAGVSEAHLTSLYSRLVESGRDG
jgi:protein-tyrosine phosphatase